MDTNENTQTLSHEDSFKEFLLCRNELHAIFDRMRKCEQLCQADFISSALINLQAFLVDHYNNPAKNCFSGTPEIVKMLDKFTYMDAAKELNYGQSPADGGNG